ncbi:MAG: TonB family protein [Bacteroidales bacterium]|nr:TonB family protein [Bacteroidales bacterium]
MMKKLVLVIAAALVAAVSLQAQYRSSLEDLYDSETVRAFKEHVRVLSGAQMEGRKAGSEGEAMAADYLARQFKELGVDVLSYGTQFSLAREGDTLRSQNVVGFLQGWDKNQNDHYIVIGARLDNLGTDTYMLNGERVNRIYYGANGNASGMAMMLELARKLSLARTLIRRSVLFVGFGGSCESFSGAWYFLNRSFKDVDKIDAMVNLDMLGTGQNGLFLYTASNADLNTLASSLQGELLPIQARVVTQAPYPGDYTAFYDKEIPAALFTTGQYPEHDTGRDTYEIVHFGEMEKELEYIYSYVQNLCNGPRLLFRNSSIQENAVPVGTMAWSDVDVKPMFLNSADPRTFMEKWVYQYLKYPKYAVENGIQGRVLVDFVIDETGNVIDVRVSRGVHVALDEEALRVVSASPKWRPGRHQGKKVRTALTVAVDFKLEKKKGKFGINGQTVK